jgi:hypothetical protein
MTDVLMNDRLEQAHTIAGSGRSGRVKPYSFGYSSIKESPFPCGKIAAALTKMSSALLAKLAVTRGKLRC